MKRKLLQIDDHQASRLLIQKSLNSDRWQVKTCVSPEAMTQATTELWDVILLEVALVQINGLDLLKQLQSHPDSQTIPVILLTSRVMPDEMAHYQQLPIAGVIAKPFDIRTLPQEIAQKLGWPLCDYSLFKSDQVQPLGCRGFTPAWGQRPPTPHTSPE